jgi:hypothetical protein
MKLDGRERSRRPEQRSHPSDPGPAEQHVEKRDRHGSGMASPVGHGHRNEIEHEQAGEKKIDQMVLPTISLLRRSMKKIAEALK